MNLFFVDQNFDLQINNDLLTYVPEFRRIAKRSGRKLETKTGVNELKYVFYMADWTKRNLYAGLPDKERIIAAKNASELESKWQPDKVVLDAIRFYEEAQQDLFPKAKMLITLKRSVRQQASLIEKRRESVAILQDSVENLIKNSPQRTPGELRTLIADVQSLQEILTNELTTITNLVKTLAAAFKTLDSLEEEMMETLNKSLEVAGGGQPYSRELPGYRIM